MSVKSGTLRCPKCGEDVINDYDHWQKKGDKWIFHYSSTYDGWEWAYWYGYHNGPSDCRSPENNVGKNMVDQLLMIGMKNAKINGPAINVKKQENHFWNLLKKNKY